MKSLTSAARTLLYLGLLSTSVLLLLACVLLCRALPFSSRMLGTLLQSQFLEQSARSMLFCTGVLTCAAQELTYADSRP